jgi:hypothetical protein
MRKKKWRPKTAMIRSVSRSLLCSASVYLLFVLFSTLIPGVLPESSAAANDKLKPSDAYALLFGTVWGPDDRPVYGIRVRIRRATDKKPHWELVSDHSGEFAQRVPAGEADYVISADLKGVKTTDGQPVHLQQEVTVHVDYDERVDMSLHLTR